MNKSKFVKKLSATFVCLLSLFLLTSCSLVVVKPLGEIEPKQELDETKAGITVAISSDSFNETAVLTLPDNCDSGEYFRQLCNKKDVVIKGVDDGYVTSINDISSEGDFAWMFFINGELSDVGIGDYIPQSGDVISLEYVDWTKIF